MKTQIGMIALLGGVALLMSGCAASSAVAEGPIAASDQQVAELQDGVTQQEYDAAFERFSECMSKAGADLIGVERGEYLVSYSYTDEAKQAGTYARCYVSQFEQIDMAWQLANVDRSETTKVLRACLEAEGITASEKALDLWAQFEDSGLDTQACLEAGAPGN